MNITGFLFVFCLFFSRSMWAPLCVVGFVLAVCLSIAPLATALVVGALLLWFCVARLYVVHVRNKQCVFCAINAGKVPCEAVEGFASDEFCCFRDIRPEGRVHLLVVPRRHIRDCFSAESTASLFRRMQTAARAALELLGEAPAGAKMGFVRPPFNTVMHLHLHVIVDSKRKRGPWMKFFFSDWYPFWPVEEAIKAKN